MPPAVAEDGTYRAWRCVVERIATVAEIRDRWTIEDVLDANQMLDLLAADQGGAA